MTARTWIGGGDNLASDPNDWSDPNGQPGAPQPGDTLYAGETNPLTMNITGNTLAGDRLNIIGLPNMPVVFNLLDHAVVTVDLSGQSEFNLSEKSTLTLTGTPENQATVYLSQNSTVNLTGSGSYDVYVSGNDTISATPGPVDEFPTSTLISLEPGARLSGTLGSPVFIGGGAGSTFNNDGTSVFYGPNTIDTDVSGTGAMILASGPAPSTSELEFAKSVGPRQSISDSGVLRIDQTNLFAAEVTLYPTNPPLFPLPQSQIDLMGLATADSYSYKNDMLNIWSGNKIIDTLRVTSGDPYGFEVLGSSSGVTVVALTAGQSPSPDTLPVHVGT